MFIFLNLLYFLVWVVKHVQSVSSYVQIWNTALHWVSPLMCDLQAIKKMSYFKETSTNLANNLVGLTMDRLKKGSKSMQQKP